MPQGPIPVDVVNSAAIGNSWFVDELTGNDAGPGSAGQPFATLDAAIAAAVPLNNDVVYLIGSSHRTSTLNWNKNGVSLVGLAAPSANDRARISSTGATAFSPLVNVTGQGCAFVNLGTFHGGFTGATGSQVCWAEAGGRNFYSNVQFLGGGDATTAALAGMRSLTVAGSGENLFQGCSVGLDTVARATNANASLELLSGTARNRFEDCVFQMLSSLAGNCHVKAGATSLDRYCFFKGCFFINAVDSTAIPITYAIIATSNAGGSIVLDPTCVSLGATHLAQTTTGPVYVSGASAAATPISSSLALLATSS